MKNTKNGTSFYIKNLFYNTPARLKFIKSKNSEKIQLKKIIYSFLLSHPNIQFSIKWDEKEKEVYKSVTDLNYQKRFEQLVYGKNKPTSPILVSTSTYEGHTLKIYFTLEAQKNSPNKHQYLFANGRIFYDKNLHMAIIRSTDSIWKYGESGHYIVLIDCPSDEIDVNVHPNKTQLKFSKSDIIYSLLVTNIKNAIKDFNSTSPIAANSNNLNEEIPMSFLTKDEEEKYSLQEIKDKTFFRKPIPSSVTQISSSDNSVETIKTFYDLNDHCFVFENNFKKFIANKKLIFIHYLFSLCQDCLIKEENISPLLISEPFKIKSNIDIHFEAMKKMGFEFDRLNQEVIVLRTIPRLIHRDLIKHSAHFLLSYYETNPKNSFELLNIKKSAIFKNLNLLLDSSLMYKIYESKILNWPDCSVEVNAETFSSFFL
jgi:DNA mismatch repair protein MutL